MTKCTIAIAITLLPAALWAQNTGTAFQYVFTGGAGPGGGIVTLDKFGGIGGKVVTGRPFSAVEERHSLQILGDGTRIESKSADKFYRDDMGRTRTEREDGTIMINDPVSGTGAEVSSNGRVMRRMITKTSTSSNAAYSITSDNAVMMNKLNAEAEAMAKNSERLSVDKTKLDLQIAEGSYKVKTSAGLTTTSNEIHNEEKLGLQVTNGISAEGTRNTTTIPAGQIGNDRPISVVSERWYSPDLQMLIKSTNKDPRFGETTYEMTNIITGTVDPTLFTVPPGKLGDTVK